MQAQAKNRCCCRAVPDWACWAGMCCYATMRCCCACSEHNPPPTTQAPSAHAVPPAHARPSRGTGENNVIITHRREGERERGREGESQECTHTPTEPCESVPSVRHAQDVRNTEYTSCPMITMKGRALVRKVFITSVNVSKFSECAQTSQNVPIKSGCTHVRVFST